MQLPHLFCQEKNANLRIDLITGRAFNSVFQSKGEVYKKALKYQNFKLKRIYFLSIMGMLNIYRL